MNLPLMYSVLNERINPYIDNISRSHSSYTYLEAQRCATVSIGERNLRDILGEEYPAFFTGGFLAAQLGVHSGYAENPALFLPAVHNPAHVQANATDKETWDQVSKTNGLPDDVRETAWNLTISARLSQDEIIEKFSPHVPRLSDAFDAWQETPLKNLQLTTVGIAIGHAHARKSGFVADLGIWID
ncbi:MAG: hypothetical protein QHC67_18495 [Sphingobium sp.]|nr:hypothetical protein [Sphingobium sp.]